MMIRIKVKAVDYQRNGCSGAGFHIVHFAHEGDEMVGIVFEKPKHVAVITPWSGKEWIQLHWRGDYFEDALREAVDKYRERTLGAAIQAQEAALA